MIGNIEMLKTKILQSLRQDFKTIRPRAVIKQVHQEIWQVRGQDPRVGVEFLLERANFWVTTQNVLRSMPTSVDRVDYVPNGRG